MKPGNNTYTKQKESPPAKFLLPMLSLAAAVALLTPAHTQANEVDLTQMNPDSIDADVGGTAWFSLADSKPTGTGVFDPFLRLQPDGQGSLDDKNMEQAYNTDGRIGAQAPMDAKSDPNYTHSLQVQDLAVFNYDFGNGMQSYYVFELDAHEPEGDPQQLLSIDNIRIYTAPVSDGGDATTSNIDDLGTLRFAMNEPNAVDPTVPVAGLDNYVKFDAGHDYSTGSGASDVFAYIPTSAFGDAAATDYVYFYNLNGVHYKADDGTAAGATFEEWRALTSTPSVPDGGSSLALLGFAMVGITMAARRKQA